MQKKAETSLKKLNLVLKRFKRFQRNPKWVQKSSGVPKCPKSNKGPKKFPKRPKGFQKRFKFIKMLEVPKEP